MWIQRNQTDCSLTDGL
ncbi:hypothetical protein PN466_09685 [Roseofilum reptotaenium CS-1145]|nr:hypothetical protein [Roseofilum reptotaenium CS-1145]